MVKLLIKHGADINQICKIGTALSISADIGTKVIRSLLLQEGADVDAAIIMLGTTCSEGCIQTARQTLDESVRQYKNH
jgi:hypothetical protein